MDNGNDPPALTPNSEFSDEKQKITKYSGLTKSFSDAVDFSTYII